MPTISLLGSTGSIGRQSLDVIAACGMSVAAITANKSTALLEEQARQFRPKLVVAYDPEAAKDLKVRLADLPVRIASGMEGLVEAATIEEADTVLTSVVGMIGLKPTLAAIGAKKRIALANKETLVCAGELVMRSAEEAGAEIIPVDSEHSALFQCLECNRDRGEVKRLILTASGGPFFGRTREQLAHVTRADALKHPNWSMGAKITTDSATLMNKGLEFIEAMRLYRMPPEKIAITGHRQSIIHSMVEYCDNAVLAQLGVPDMRLPIEYALTYPRRAKAVAGELDLLRCPPLTFEEPDCHTFRCLALALEAAKQPGNPCAVLNGANEAAVGLFLEDKISFLQIADLVDYALEQVPKGPADTLEQVLAADAAAREAVKEGFGRRL
ncbi:MAG: 1-deoxy-D-xylulose-5-phosphate reductoisomerase [Oscillospiraceae bacterium]|nr:1-deoxy-D-xylulose-5-phosphate reductoisomerase [Oscillospiraceae bacterium]